MEMLQYFIQSYANRWAHDLIMERTIGIPTKNSMVFSDIDKFGEVLCSLLTGMYGKGGRGSGHDLSNGMFAAEVKTVCWCQPWECKTCSVKGNKKKSPWTSTSCLHCGSTALARVNDSRAGISANAHLKYIDVLKEYYVVLIDHIDAEEYAVKVWKIESSNPYFDNYVRTQAANGSKDTCNMIPGKYDFHMSGPRLIFKIKLWLGSSPKFETEKCDKIEDVPYILLRKDEQEKVDVCDYVPYDVACERLVIRKKSHGKPRGETTRNP